MVSSMNSPTDENRGFSQAAPGSGQFEFSSSSLHSPTYVKRARDGGGGRYFDTGGQSPFSQALERGAVAGGSPHHHGAEPSGTVQYTTVGGTRAGSSHHIQKLSKFFMDFSRFVFCMRYRKFLSI